MRRFVARCTAVAFLVVAALHIAWGRGSSIPFRSRSELADAVVGSAEVPPPPACYAVASALIAAAGLVLDAPIAPRSLRRIGRHIVTCVLLVRAGFGFAGRTDLLVPGSASPRFRQLDRRYLSPICATLAVGVAVAQPTSKA